MSLRSTNSPLTEEQAELLNKLLPSLDPHQVTWLTGYLAGVSAASSSTSPALRPAGGTAVADAPVGVAGPVPGVEAAPAAVTVLYASQTGNCAWLAQETSRRLEAHGFAVALTTMSAMKPRKLKDVSYLLVLVSTQGDGVPPDNGLLFYEDLLSKKAPALEGLRYSVLALGDISYEDFCTIGRSFDRRLAELGAQSLYPRVDCDLDFQDPAEGWMNGVLEALVREAQLAVPAAVPSTSTSVGLAAATTGAAARPTPAAAASSYSRFHPFDSEILENINLNGQGSGKETHHVELSLEGSGLVFEPGDSIGIYPQNDPRLVDLLIDEMG